jgi:hypothetical protein
MQLYEWNEELCRRYADGLHGAEVRERMLKAGFADVDYVRSGFNYLLVGAKGT